MSLQRQRATTACRWIWDDSASRFLGAGRAASGKWLGGGPPIRGQPGLLRGVSPGEDPGQREVRRRIVEDSRFASDHSTMFDEQPALAVESRGEPTGVAAR